MILKETLSRYILTKEILSWEPQVTLDDGLEKRTIRWYRGHCEEAKIFELRTGVIGVGSMGQKSCKNIF